MLDKIKYFWQQSWLLIVSAFCFGLLIAITNTALSERIEKNQVAKLYENMRLLITDANNFNKAIEKLPVADRETTIYKAVDDSNNITGFAFVALGSGFADKIWLVIAVDSKCEKFLGFKVLQSSETPGFGTEISNDFYNSQFIGAPAGKLELVKSGDAEMIDSQIVAISGATVSSEAVVDIFNSYIGIVKEQLISEGLISNGK
ncbi:MAG: FMN-binding protein [Planctomycetota bacterium]